jgi:hypothetical protein
MRKTFDECQTEYLIGNTWLSAKNFIRIQIEDAPVFDKPVLRKIASLKENECIEIPNDTILDLVLIQAEREGLKWDTGIEVLRFKPETPCSIAFKYKGEFYGMSYSSIGFHKQQKDTILPASKFVEVPQQKEEPITEHQKEECKTADERIKELENETITQGEQANVATPFSNWLEKVFKDPYMKETTVKDFSAACANSTIVPNERIKELENDCINVRQVNNDLFVKNDKLYSQLETIKRLAKIAIQHEDYEHMRVILKSIANGEI